MKMGFISSGVFWGVLLIIAGILIILKIIFGVNIPVFKVLLGLFFIYLGIRIIAGASVRDKDTSIFEDNKIHYNENNSEHNVVFSKSILDYTKAPITETTKILQVHLVFSDGTLLIDDNMPVKLKVKGVFSGCSFPNGTTISFGEYTYTTKAFSESKPYLLINADVVFSALKVKNKTGLSNDNEYSY